jgi:hypothetical protein
VTLPGAGPRSGRKRARCRRFIRGNALERQAVTIRGCCDDGQGETGAAMMLALRVKKPGHGVAADSRGVVGK